MCVFLVPDLPFVNVLGPRVSGYDDTPGYHSPANAADPPAASAEPPAAPGSPPAAAGPHASTGNCRPARSAGARTPHPPSCLPVEELPWQAKWHRTPPGPRMISVTSVPLKKQNDATGPGLGSGECPVD